MLVTDPGWARRLLAEQARQTTKGPGLQLTRPLLGNGLLTSEGTDHARARRLVAPAFSPRRLDGYVEMFGACTTSLTEQWADGAELDIHREMATLTLNIVGRTLLGIDLTQSVPAVRSGLEAALEQFSGNSGPGFTGPAVRREAVIPELDEAAIASVHALVDQIIDERREHPAGDRGDVDLSPVGRVRRRPMV